MLFKSEFSGEKDQKSTLWRDFSRLIPSHYI